MRTKIAILGAVAALIVAACGDDASPTTESAGAGTTPTTASPTTAPPTTAPPTTAPPTTMAEHDDEGMGDEHDDEGMGDEHDEGHEDDGHEAAEVDREVTVIMSEFAFEPATVQVTAGETVRFLLDNQGAVEHEFRLTTAHAAEEHIASGHEGHDDEGAGDHGHGEVIVLVPAGGQDVVDVTFMEAGEFDTIACLIPGHFEAGMKGEIAVG